MQLQDEQAAVKAVTEFLFDAAAALYKGTRYIYSLSQDDFYNVDVKDAFKILLNNIQEAEKLHVLGLSLDDERCAAMNVKEYKLVFSLIVYSFAVRLPTLRQIKIGGERPTEGQIQAIYDAVMNKGVINHDEVVEESFDEISALVRKNRPVPPYSGDWYKAFVCKHIPALAALTNRNMFLFGVADVLFVMFYLRVEQELIALLESMCVQETPA